MNVKKCLLSITTTLFYAGIATAQQPLELNKSHDNIRLSKADTLAYLLPVSKNGIYQLSVDQQGIALVYEITGKKGMLVKSRRPDDITGKLKSEFTAASTGNYLLKIYRYADPENTDSGKLSILIHRLSKTEIAKRQRLKKVLAPENAKTVLTLDIDHFWQAFDSLKHCRSYADSVHNFQSLYLDRSTDGLTDYISARDLTAEKLVNAVGRYTKFYASIRQRTAALKQSEPLIDSLFNRFKQLYPGFHPPKVCFVIGVINSGGTVSDRFVLIGAEILSSSNQSDVSEFIKEKNTAKVGLLTQKGDLLQRIRNIVAHECVHTQQKPMAPTAEKCPLLYQVLREGICDFIGELVAGQQINGAAHTYGNNNEAQLWKELSANLCSGDLGQWLYNAGQIKDRPADLGYYIGYRIAKSYYENATDKRQAIIDIIEMNDPKRFLELSRYDSKIN